MVIILITRNSLFKVQRIMEDLFYGPGEMKWCWFFMETFSPTLWFFLLYFVVVMK